MLNEICEPVTYQKRPMQYLKRPTTQYMSKETYEFVTWQKRPIICQKRPTNCNMSKETHEPVTFERGLRTCKETDKRGLDFCFAMYLSNQWKIDTSLHATHVIWAFPTYEWVMSRESRTYQRGSRPTSYDDTWPYMSHIWMIHIIHVWMWQI